MEKHLERMNQRQCESGAVSRRVNAVHTAQLNCARAEAADSSSWEIAVSALAQFSWAVWTAFTLLVKLHHSRIDWNIVMVANVLICCAYNWLSEQFYQLVQACRSLLCPPSGSMKLNFNWTMYFAYKIPQSAFWVIIKCFHVPLEPFSTTRQEDPAITCISWALGNRFCGAGKNDSRVKIQGLG